MTLNLLSRIQAKKISVEGITSDSRQVKKNFLFFAIKGSNIDGNQYIKEVLKKKPSAIITSTKSKIKTSVPIILVSNVRKEYASAAYSFYYSNINKKIAITGTNGKTSVVFFIEFILRELGSKCGTIGTLGSKFKDIQSNLTTPDPIDISRLLHKFSKNNYDAVAMEASSHALDQYRLHGLSYDVLALTNVSHDHLDYHKNINNYIDAKLKLFAQNQKSNGINIIVNDTKNYLSISRKLKSRKIKFKTFGYKKSDFQIKEIFRLNDKVKMELKYDLKKYVFEFNNLPTFQIKNFLLAASIVFKLGYEFNSISALSLRAPSVPGRMELAGIKANKSKVFIDFAHTPDALSNVLKEAKIMNKGRLHLVFGCGGDRDKDKRSLMGKVALKYADNIIVTDDNPRNENPQFIRQQIIGYSKKILEIPDRKKAIKYAAENLGENDILIIAGKGHEKFQIMKNKSTPFDDVKISRRYI